MSQINIQNQNFLSIEQLTDRYLGQTGKPEGKTEQAGVSFKEVLQQKTSVQTGPERELKFSRHASERLKERGIELNDSQLEKLQDGVRRAGQKGIKDSLVIVDDLAFIVNVPNHTVVTAMDGTQITDNVFTNINGAVIM